MSPSAGKFSRRVLLVATSGKPSGYAEQLGAGAYPRIDYVDAVAKWPHSAYIDYDSIGERPAWQALEAALRLDLRLALHAHRRIRIDGYDVVVSMSERVGLPLAALLGHSVRHIVIPCHLLSRAKFRLTRVLRLHQRWDRILTLTHAEADAVRRACPDARNRVAVLPRWVDTRFFAPNIPALVPGGDDEPHVLSVGLSYRDYSSLMGGMRLLPHIRCRIRAGSAWVAGNIPMGMPANVTSCGMAPLDLLRAEYAHARLVVVPIRNTTQWSAGATAALEAQAMAKAVVASRTPGMPDYVLHGETGLLVEPHDPEALAAAIDELWSDPARLAAMGQRAREWVAHRFSLEQWRATLAEFCQA